MKKYLLFFIPFYLFSMTQDNPEIIVNEHTQLETKEVICDDGFLGFTLTIQNNRAQNKIVYFSCTDPDMKGKYSVIDNTQIEPAGVDFLVHGNLGYFNREYDGTNMTYAQAEKFCSDLGGRLPTLEEVENTYSAKGSELELIHTKDVTGTFTTNYWTSSTNGVSQHKSYSFDDSTNPHFNSKTNADNNLRYSVKCVKNL